MQMRVARAKGTKARLRRFSLIKSGFRPRGRLGWLPCAPLIYERALSESDRNASKSTPRPQDSSWTPRSLNRRSRSSTSKTKLLFPSKPRSHQKTMESQSRRNGELNRNVPLHKSKRPKIIPRRTSWERLASARRPVYLRYDLRIEAPSVYFGSTMLPSRTRPTCVNSI